MTSTFPIATVFNVVKEIQTQVQLSKANRVLCKRVGSELDALEPILTDVANRANTFLQQQQEIIAKALTMLQQDLESTLELIRCQNKGNDGSTGRALAFKVKRFVMARGVNEQFEDAERNIEKSKSTLMFALLNQIGASTSTRDLNVQQQFNTPQQAGGPPPAQQQQQQVQSTPTKEDILRLMDSPNFMDAIPLAQQVLRDGQSGDSIFANYVIASCHARSGNAEAAVTHLFAAKQAGFKDFEQLDQDPYFSGIQGHAEFAQLRNQIQQEVLAKERWRRLPQAQVDDIMRIFDQYDLDGSGKIDAKEFEVLMARTRPDQAANSAQIFQSLDADQSGHIALDEYLNYIADQILQSGNVPQPQYQQQPPQQYQQPAQPYQGQQYEEESGKKDKKDKKDKKKDKEEKKKEKEEKKDKKDKKDKKH